MPGTYTPPVSEPPETIEFHGVPATRVKRGWSVAIYITGCAYCEAELARGNFYFPSHFANPHHGHHCTCDGCF